MSTDFRPDQLLLPALRKARHMVTAHLFRDRGGADTPTVVVAGVARSGTTWLGEVLAACGPARMMFEPFHARRVTAYRHFEYLQYLRPESDGPELLSFADEVLRGRVRDPGWIDKNAEHLNPRMRVVKDVRICMFLRWLSDRFPDVPMIYIVRHPCAVVGSCMQLGWTMEYDLRSVLSQPELIEDHLESRVEWLRGLRDPLEQIAAAWCIQNLVALRQLRGSRVPVVFYEDMVRDPERVLPGVYDAARLEFDPAVLDVVGRHSSTVTRGSPLRSGEDPTSAWTRRMRPEQIQSVLEIVESFGLDSLYAGSDPALDADDLRAMEF